MTAAQRPRLAPTDDLSAAADIDISTAIAPLIEQRYQSPVVRSPKAGEVASQVDEGFPHDGESLEQLVDQISNAFELFPRRNTHPGFFGWVAPSGLPSDPLAHAMSCALNQNLIGYWASPVGTTIEKAVVRWLAELVGLPQASEGILLSGGSLSNLSGIASALAKLCGPDYRQQGLGALASGPKPVILCSAEAHFSIRTAVAVLGLGTDNIVAIETDHEFRMRADRLEQALQQQQNVVCVVATAGTTNSGAIDPLEEIATLCQQHGAWLHIDAALGGGGLMSEQLRPRYRGIEKADSVVLDLHKWFFQSLSGSLLLYRDAGYARQMFLETSDYIPTVEQSIPEQYAFFHLAPELSRPFRALPFYLAMRCYGIDRLGRNALHNVQCTEYLAELIRQHDEVELIVEPQLCILCFRYRPAGLEDSETDRINSEIRDQIQREGEYLMSATRVHGRPVLRVCIINHATRVEHVEGLLESVLRIGQALVQI